MVTRFGICKIIGLSVVLSVVLAAKTGLAQTCSGTCYYVSWSSGNDSNSGTSQSSPWQTIGKVQANLVNLQAGDGVFFKRGDTWTGSGLTPTSLNGSASAPITFGSYGTGAAPIIDGGGTGGANACFLANGGPGYFSYITIDGWECRNTLQYGIYFHDYGTPGQTGMPGIVVKNMTIHHTGPGAYSPGGTGAFDDGNYRNQLMFLDETHRSDGTQFLNNIVHDCGGHNCIQIHGDTGSPLVQRNTCYNWVHNCIDLKAVMSATVNRNTVHGPNPQGACLYNENTDIANDYVTFSENVCYSAPNGIECESPGLFGKPVTCNAYNNTIYLGNQSAIVTGSCTQPVTWDVRNNILDTSSIYWFGSGCQNVTVTHWDYNDDGASSGFVTEPPFAGAHDLDGINPQYVNAPSDFHLQSTSPVLNSGDSSVLGVSYMGACGTSGTCP